MPILFRDKLETEKLIEPSPDKRRITIYRLIDEYKKTRVGLKENTLIHDKRVYSYLIEYFGGNKWIDEITPCEATGIRDYLTNIREGGKGKLLPTSTNKIIVAIKPIFRYACDCRFLEVSPFEKVKGGSTSNPERQYYVSYDEIKSAIDACGNNVEMAGILAFARYAGLRIPSEINDLKFSDFTFSVFGVKGSFKVPKTGKTGVRKVPFFEELRPHFMSIYSAKQPNQEYVFERYRKHVNPAPEIQKKMRKKGLPIWEKFFVNLRSSCITDKEYKGWNEATMNAVFGNTENVRIKHYIQPMQDDAFEMLGQQQGNRKEYEIGRFTDNAVTKDIVNKLSKIFLTADNQDSYDEDSFSTFAKGIIEKAIAEIPTADYAFPENLHPKFIPLDIVEFDCEIYDENKFLCADLLCTNDYCIKIMRCIISIFDSCCGDLMKDFHKKILLDKLTDKLKKFVWRFDNYIRTMRLQMGQVKLQMGADENGDGEPDIVDRKEMPLIVEKYADPDTSGLTFTVDGKTKTFDIKVERGKVTEKK
ncbi:MAG: hypothetical protein LBJ00_16005 [Planctomycetaceae bacterium]|nr:hypothetical protein [Planctomycetaceae bacterium]